jgi:hypothetical protein
MCGMIFSITLDEVERAIPRMKALAVPKWYGS